jgi:hypothetical protein
VSRILGGLLLLFSCAAQLSAQIVRGTIRDAESAAPLQGVFVMLLDSAQHMRGGVLTDERGFFVMRAPAAGTFTLRAERIGHESAMSSPVLLNPEQAQTVDLNVTVAAIQLAPLEVATRNRCIARPRSGERTAQLWEEARKALTVARWLANEKQIQFQSRAYVRELDAKSMAVKSEGVRQEISRNLPYAALDADTLTKYGFVRDQGDGLVFYGPDAEVLLSKVFLDGHCFHSVEGAGNTRGMVGLGFKPVAESKLPDVEGVLWLDRQTFELRHIDYRYTNMLREFRVNGTGGRTDFVRLKSGAWIVSKWYIRMPAVVASTMERGEFRLLSLREEGGEVLSIQERGAAESLHHDGALRGALYDSVRGRPLADALVYLSGTAHSARTDAAGRFHMPAIPAGRYTIAFTHPSLDSLPALPEPKSIAIALDDTARIDLAIRPLAELIARRCGGAVQGAVLFGKVKNARGNPLPYAMVRIANKAYRTGGDGEYTICGLRPDSQHRVVVSLAGEVVAESVLNITGLPVLRFDFRLQD